ncbi:MAG: alpha-D-glucose phosphate-specific phosphoglucomutase [Deltaproteobacteria bacterium]|nr:alpha-D-glucose phosphate-specific phosphoglucomutase [Deltaproteobacteria bacterium]
MEIETIKFSPFKDQRPGTSGLRKKTKYFMQEHYLESFIQAAINAVRLFNQGDYLQAPLVIGGDGRYYNDQAIQKIIKVALANGYQHIMVACTGVLSTPGTSAVIRTQKASGGFLLTASHNPGGMEHDFGIKYNIANGGPAPEKVTEAIYAQSKELTEYKVATVADVDINKIGETMFGSARVEVFDALVDYTKVLESLFDFEMLAAFFKNGFTMRFDAMHAATGPIAKHIIERILGAAPGTVVRANPLPDFGGLHPDPNQVHAKELMDLMWSGSAPMFGAASDGDGDRNMILGQKFFVSPGDSLAVIADQAASCIRGYSKGLSGVARSMPTSRAVDLVAKAQGLSCYETPTGWKYFGNLMDAGRCTVCGEESFGTGSDHVREKDGLWAVLCWLSILAKTKLSVAEIVQRHWRKYGRYYYQRHDHEGLALEPANEVIAKLRASLPSLVGQKLGAFTISAADDFSYTDPIDSSVSSKQGIRLICGEDERVVIRLSGTGTEGATMRIYYERFCARYEGAKVEDMLGDTVRATKELLKMKEMFGHDEPDVIT